MVGNSLQRGCASRLYLRPIIAIQCQEQKLGMVSSSSEEVKTPILQRERQDLDGFQSTGNFHTLDQESTWSEKLPGTR